MISLFFLIALLLLLSAFFSGTEIAFITANKLGVEIERDKGTRRSKLISSFYANPKAFLSATLVGNNIVLVIFSYSMASLIEPWLLNIIPSEVARLLIITVISTMIILVIGEYLPKIIFRLFANRALLPVAYPMYSFNGFFASRHG
jgi:CBS domain containing-hemolysin-like protein